MAASGYGRGIINSLLPSFLQCRLLATPKFQHASPRLAMPRSRKNKEDPNLEPRQPWDTQAAPVSRTEPKPKRKLVTLPVAPEPVVVDATVAPEPWTEPVVVDATVAPEPETEPVVVAATVAPEPETEPVVVAATVAPEPETEPVVVAATVAQNPPTTSRKTAGPPSTASEAEIDALGRELTKILRHKALDFRLPIRSDGYVEVAELLKLNVITRARDALNRGKRLSSFSEADVQQAAAMDSKQRLGLVVEGDKLFIRANQGHSMQVIVSERLLKPVLDARQVPVCVHGTYRRNLKCIFAEGLSKMKRLHVHFATGLPNEAGVISGMRASCEVLIHLDVEKALKAGMLLFRSENGVILTEGLGGIVPTEYFSRVESLPDRKQIQIPSKLVE